MTLIDDNIWLMEPERHRAMVEARDIMASDANFMGHMAAYNGQEPKPYAMRGDVALINFEGPITVRDSFFSWLMGGAVLPALADQIRAADKDPDVSAIVLIMNSPGGPPAGLAGFTNMLRGLNTPIMGFCDGMVASGALWVSSALDGLVISKTASVGSIGVIAVLEDITEAAAQQGVKFTVLRAGKYKALGIRYEALTGEAKTILQAEIDALYSVFIDEVASNMGKTPEQILEVADGKIFIGEQAVTAGLADKTGFLEDAIDMALNDNESIGGSKMAKEIKNVEALKEAYPELCAELEKSVDFSETVKTGVTAETVRLLGLVVGYFGEDDGAKFKAVVDSGVTLEQYNSIKDSMPAAAPAKPAAAVPAVDPKAAALDALHKDTPAPVGADAGAGTGPATFEAAWKLVKDELKCNTQKAMSMAAKRYPALHAEITGGAK